MRPTRLAAALALAAPLCTGASAAVLLNAAPTGALETNTGLSLGFVSGNGPAQLALQLQGYATLDGDNFWIDLFHLQLDGVEWVTGSWDLGGGGVDRLLLSPAAAQVTHSAGSTVVDLRLDLDLGAGAHLLTLSYESPNAFDGTARAGFQGLGDEGWGINSLSVSGAAASAVPEPLSFGLAAVALLAGGRRRRPR